MFIPIQSKMDNAMSPQEIVQLLRERRYLDVKILPLSLYVLEQSSIYDKPLYPDRIVIDGNDKFVEITIRCCLSKLNYYAQVYDKNPHITFLFSYLSSDLRDIITMLGRHDLHMDPFIKKCIKKIDF